MSLSGHSLWGAMWLVCRHLNSHLLHQNHSSAFWRTLGETMPQWAESKKLLEQWEGAHRAV
ncbi:MAG TPA: M48 family peptidase [Gemmatimonadetes bacterium]|nr:M48 family peptidase [Gemmatimonadota bacterium]